VRVEGRVENRIEPPRAKRKANWRGGKQMNWIIDVVPLSMQILLSLSERSAQTITSRTISCNCLILFHDEIQLKAHLIVPYVRREPSSTMRESSAVRATSKRGGKSQSIALGISSHIPEDISHLFAASFVVVSSLYV